MSNALSADTEFHINYRRVELQSPFLVVCCTDGCFGYVRTPMHFEYLVLSHLLRRVIPKRGRQRCRPRLQPSRVTMRPCRRSGVGADLKEFQELFAPRVGELASDFIEPLDELSDAVTRAEQELRALQSRQLNEMTEKWNRYTVGLSVICDPRPRWRTNPSPVKTWSRRRQPLPKTAPVPSRRRTANRRFPARRGRQRRVPTCRGGRPIDRPSLERTEEASS